MSLELTYNCKEKAASFTKNDSGAFCSHCQRNIIDLTTKSRSEIRGILDANPNDICASIYADQLRDSSPALIKTMSLAALVTVAISAPIASFAQDGTRVLTEQEIHPKPKTEAVSITEEKEVKATCESDEPTEVIAQKEVKRVSVLRVGATYLFLKNRFPFIEVRRMVKGRVRRR